MPDLARFANRFRFLVVLRFLLLLAAVLEVIVALLLLATPAILTQALGLPEPGTSLPFHLLAITLLLLAALGWEAARDPRRYSAIVRTAIAGHLLAAAVFTVAAVQHATPAALLWLAVGNALLGLVLAGIWWSVRS